MKGLLLILGAFLLYSLPDFATPQLASPTSSTSNQTNSSNVTSSPTNGTTTENCGSGLTCYNGGRCNSTYNCICPDGYQGYDCSRESCEGRCRNNGTCYDGYCSCSFGYSGQYCENLLEVCGLAPNRTICYNNGSCVNNSCVCTSEYTGQSCTEYYCDPPCMNDAYCSSGNYCSCSNGFTGSRCEIAPGPVCGSSYCYNNGTCDVSNGNCTCVGNYLPPYCRLRACAQPCQNNASCYDGYCSCSFGYTGQYCETVLEVCGAFNQTICYNNGTCENNTCNCVYPYTGSDCSSTVAVTSTLPPSNVTTPTNMTATNGTTSPTNGTTPVNCGSGLTCYNGGRCNSTYNCICPDGYQGYNCNLESCEGRCRNNGTCYDGYCSCSFGYSGQYCENLLEVCGLAPNRTICYNNGSCVNNTCVCTSEYTGQSCTDYVCDPPCMNDAYCSSGNYCSCSNGFTGSRCEIAPGPVCGSSYCYNNGTCDVSIGNCTCLGNYLPPYCRLRACAQPCQNNAFCYDGYCSCSFEYTGQYCETVLEVCGAFNETICYNNGTCENNTCNCVYPYTGSDCSYTVAVTNMTNNNTTPSPTNGTTPTNGTSTNGTAPPTNGTTSPTNGTTPVNCGSGLYCYNGGRCNSTSNCICPDGYQGYDCSRESCEGRCRNNGTCYDGYCSCSFGYSGQYCQNVLEVCGLALNRTICYNNGSCVNNTCVCTSEYTGQSCNDYVCDPPCMNDAYCSSGNYCSCSNGFRGSRCEIAPGPVCGSSYCYNNGTCDVSNGNCTCVGNYLPPYCRLRACAQPCQNNASCYDGYCSCTFGYTGQYCETELEVCGMFRSTICYNNGTCDDNNNTCVCSYPYTGYDCSNIICDTVCLNGGSCIGNACQCPPDYSGSSCETYTYCPGGCNGAECINGTCNCPYPYTGYACSGRICDPPCENGGYCWNGTCICGFQFSGRSCEITPGPECDGDYCWNNGICNSDNECVCTSSYTGRYCRDEICPYECLNNGSCSQQRCYCPSGFNGTRCEIPPGPQCGSYYCWNNGTCGSNNTCECRDPYYGPDCTNRKCVPECENNGSCSGGYCNCQFGYSGERCQNEIATCGFSLCYNGTCAPNNTCVCFDGYTGYGCSERKCNPECANGGSCYDGTCSCSPGYGGSRCEIQVTPRCGQNGPLCYNGTCVNNTCVCFTGYQGNECFERSCIPECQNGGYCFDGNCTCPHPYAGRRCEAERTLCGDDTICINGNCEDDDCVCEEGYLGPNCDQLCTCINGGTCDDMGRCTCGALYTGPRCEIKIDLCEDVTCENGGRCVSTTGLCQCEGLFTGRYCETAIQFNCGSIVCRNGGTCLEAENVCQCTAEFTGAFCENPLNPPCQSVFQSFEVSSFNVTLNFSWPMTESTGFATIQCPCAANPSLTNGVFATRRCGARGVWQETTYASCVSRTFQSFCVTSGPISTDAINNILSSGEPLEAGDVALVTKAITSLISSVDLTDETSRNMLLDSINSVLSVDSDVLSMTSQTTDTSNTIVRNFETFGARIELPDSGAFTVSRTSYSLTITEVSADNVPTTGYGVDFGDDTSDSFQLPKSLFNTGSTRVSASLIKSVGIFSGRDSTKVVASNVVSLTLNGRTVLNLENSVIITITKLANAPAGMVDTCQFWDTTAEGGLGGWSTEGCMMIGDNGNSISCACDHLTSFAIVQVPGSVSTPSNPGVPVNVAAIVVPVVFGVLIISLVVIAIIAAVLLYSKRKASYSLNTGDNSVIMENVGSSPEPGSDEDTGERGVIEKETELEDMEKETPNV